MFDKIKELVLGDKKGVDKQKEKFKELVEDDKVAEDDGKIVIDKESLASDVDKVFTNSYWLGFQMAESEDNEKSDLEKLVMANLLVTGGLLLVKIAPMLGLT